MDEQEPLVCRAALGQPADAAQAWATFVQSYDVREATNLLTWAAGSIHRNLEQAGLSDSYLAGIARHNWLRNNHLLARAHDVLTEMTNRWRIVPLKSFGLGLHSNERRLRPLGDIDFFVFEKDVPDVAEFLREQGFVPQLEPSPQEFLHRIYPQRGSWNFRHESGVDLDLHWKVIDHLDVGANNALVAAHTRSVPTSYGQVDELDPALLAIILSVQQQTQQSYHLAGLFDVFYLASNLEPAQLVKVASESHAGDALHSTLGASLDVVATVPAPILELMEALPKAAPITPELRRGRRFFSRTNRDTLRGAFVRHTVLYWTWWNAGHISSFERILTRITGPFTRGYLELSGSAVSTITFRHEAGLGPGWHYTYPGQDFRWGNRPDARCAIKLGRGPALTAQLGVDAEAWAIAPTEKLSVFLNGAWVARLGKSDVTLAFTIPARSRDQIYELSFRPDMDATLRYQGAQSQWYRVSAPLRELTLSPIE
jgi:hypothetical protein